MKFKTKLIKTLLPLLRPKHLNLGTEKRFLILSTTGLGDTLWGTPAIRALRDCFPTSYIGVMTSPIGKELLKHNRYIDELFLVKNSLLPSLFSLYRALKARNITHVLSFHTSQRAILPLAALLGAQEIIGTYGINKDLDFLLTQPLDNLPIHEIERRLRITAAVGAHTLDSSMDIFLSAEEEKTAQNFLESTRIPSYFPLVAIHPGAKDTFKQWPPTHFIDLGNRLMQNLGCRILITGTPAEKLLTESIASKIEGAVSVTELPLLSLAALLKRMNVLIANDTGPMHLGFALKVPTVGLFTPTDPRLCGPYELLSAIAIAKKPTCSPCLRKRCKEPFCMRQIGVSEVYEAVQKLFYENKSPSGVIFRRNSSIGMIGNPR